MAGFDITQMLILVGVVATVALRNWSPLVYAAQLIMILAIFLHLNRNRRKIYVGVYIGFYGTFALWCLISTFWAHEADRAFDGAIGVIQLVFVGAALAAYVTGERTPEFLLDCLAWSVVVLALVLVALTPLDVWREALVQTSDASSDANRLGATVRYHPNALGRVFAIGAFIWIYKLRISVRHRTVKLLIVIALIALLLLTKSRLSIAVFVVILLLFLLFNSKNAVKFALRVGLSAVLFAIMVWAIFELPVLYEAVGFRFAAMFGPEGATDASTSTRLEMASIAFDLFGRNPLLGVGFENFAYHYFYDYSGWAETYAHNNFSELLAGLGLVGLISYYAVPLAVLVQLVSHFHSERRTKRTLASFLMLLALWQVAADFASISYTLDFVQIITVLLFSWATLIRKPTVRVIYGGHVSGRRSRKSL